MTLDIAIYDTKDVHHVDRASLEIAEDKGTLRIDFVLDETCSELCCGPGGQTLRCCPLPARADRAFALVGNMDANTEATTFAVFCMSKS